MRDNAAKGLADGALNEVIDRMIEGDQTSPATELLAKVQSMCAEIPIGDLRVAIEVHRTNCHQPSCPVLAAMEESAAARESAS